MKNIIVIDIDNTVSIVGERLKYILQKPKDWDSFYNNCDEDEPNEPIIKIIHGLINLPLINYQYFYITGRPERVRQKTLKWLNKYNLYCDTENLFMRKDHDYRPDYILKKEIIEPFKDKILMAFEDRDQVVQMYRELGITCLQVADGKY
jgi:hypothetical protein